MTARPLTRVLARALARVSARAVALSVALAATGASVPAAAHSFGGGFRHGGHDHSYGYQRACHAVQKSGYWRGRPALIGGRMCYDHHGRAYIVSGSRRLIRYRDPYHSYDAY